MSPEHLNEGAPGDTDPPGRTEAGNSTTKPETNTNTQARSDWWMDSSKCKDVSPATFFPSDGLGVQVAQRICAECVVSEPCLEFALVNRIDHGVWGGKSERERRRILRRRRAAKTAQPSQPNPEPETDQ